MQHCDVVILTDSRYVDPSATTDYVQNLLTEDRLVREALEAQGLTVLRKDWADPHFNWKTTRAILFRTTWNYFDKFDAFKQWLHSVSQQTLLINSTHTISWNMDKHYLQDLQQEGIHIVPTRFIERRANLSLRELHKIEGWDTTVLKPTVGGGGRHTYKLNQDNLADFESHFSALIADEDFMLQPFQHSIPEQGEWSYMVFGDKYSHAVLKKARKGDFRVQDDFGGTVHTYEPQTEEVDFALKAVQACAHQPAYARVDVVRDNFGKLAVSELELVEPELWFRRKPEAADLLAREVIKRLGVCRA
ncbi:MAG: hypothetical protein FH748_07435 [Balneolaceae bacterium]|nr:hypothetical protein [Balneolaceae bacterium]